MLGFRDISKGGALVLLLFCFTVKAQVNLVLNPSFELYKGNCSTATFNPCLDTGNAVTNCYATSLGTPDWYNKCEPSIGYGEPLNENGYQYPHSGNAYGGILINANPIYGTVREYITNLLSASLLSGHKYCVSFFVSLADSAWYSTGAIGAYLSGYICNAGLSDSLPYIPQIENPFNDTLSDKINWVPVSGEFNALGGEQFITIGDFNGDTVTGYHYVGNGGTNLANIGFSGKITYYFVDDVAVREIVQAHAGKDTEICNGGMALLGLDTAIGVSYHWQPTTGLANPNSAQTLASPTVTTTYTLTVVNDSMKGCNCPDSIAGIL